METDDVNLPADLRRREPLSLRQGTYFSQSLHREQPYAFYAPADWDGSLTDSTTRYPLLVMLHGRTCNYRSWHEHTRIARYAAAYNLVIAFPDGGFEGWYTNATDGSANYEDDLMLDFLPHLQATLPLLPPGRHWGIGGFSMGGYGAVKIALKHWQQFAAAVGHSGAYEKPIMPEAHSVFGDPKENAPCRRKENPFALAELALCRFPTERPFLYLDCGADDFLLVGNRRFRDHLRFIGYPQHLYAEHPGGHTYPYWDRAFRTILPTVAQRIGAEKTEI